ncbi:MAG TPA: PH domain-containing protein [Patescibacteria group bacterium]
MGNDLITDTMKQFPLSPKKFWKKFFQKILTYVILDIILFVVSFLAFLAPQDKWAFFSLGIVILAGLTLLFLLFIILPYSLYLRVYILRYYYDCSDNFITIKKGVFQPVEIHVQYQKIQDVYVDQDILDRIFGLYDVHIASATSGSAIASHIDGVDKIAAEGLKKMLLERVQGYANVSPPATLQSQTTPAQQITNTAYTAISEQVYPISGLWYAPQILGNIFSAIFILIILWTSLISKDSTGRVFMIYLAIWFISTLAHIIGMVIWKHNFKFTFGPEYITLKQGIISQEERHVPYKAIQDVKISQGLIERILGLSTVRIENATAVGYSMNSQGGGNGITIPGQPLAKGQELVSIINDITLNTKSSSTGL